MKKNGTLIILRHAQSLWNAQKLFTGCIDVPLSKKGLEEGKKAGEILKDVRFDRAYSSHLQRAIQTLHLVFAESETGQTPIYQYAENTLPREPYEPNSDREEFPVILHETALAERRYGELQGKNKEQVKAAVGEEQFKIWRRGYDTPPPGGESLKNVYDRVVPYFCGEILPRLDRGETILISAHGNSLRALTKYLEGISDEEISQLEIPTGTPIRYEIAVEMGDPRVVEKMVMD